MPDYNPNSIWGSKEKKYSYTPPSSANPSPKQKPEDPKTSDIVPSEPSFFHRHQVMFFAIGLLLALGLVGLVVYLLLPPPAPNIAISFSNPGTVVIGQPFPLAITVSNNSNSVLKNAELDIILPPGISFVGENAGQQAMTEEIDTLSSQTINPPENLQLIATGAQGAQSIAATTQNISIKLMYQTAETNATQYENDANTSVVIGPEAASAITLNYSSPSSIFSGQNFNLVVNYQNNTTSTLQGVQLNMQYPPAYNFVRSSMAPANTANDSWNIGTLAPNATGTLTITGDIVGAPGIPYQLTGTAAANYSGQNYPLYAASQAANYSVTPSPLGISILLNNASNTIARLGEALNYTLNYSNNSNVAFQTLTIQVNLVGQMYDLPSVQTQGSFNSNTNSITWNTANTPQLLSLAPGQSGSVNFSVNTRSAFPSSGKNYTLQAVAQIQSPTVPPNTAGSSTVSATNLTSEVGGVIAISAKGYSEEPTPAIKNTGPYPPKVGQATEYTIHWDITNYATDASSVTVSAYLQSGTTFTGQVESNVASSTPVYNSATGLVSWTIPYIPANTGVIGPTAEAIFQVNNTPSVAQVGQNVTLLGQTNVSSTDMFTGQTLSASAPAITTQLQDDTSIESDNRVVTQ